MAILTLRATDVLSSSDEHTDLKLALLGRVAPATASGRLGVEQVTFWLRRIFERPARA